jgi:hypothetical protein
MQEINRAMADHMDASEMLKKIMEVIPEEPRRNMLSTGHYETRTDRRARERAEAKAAKRAAQPTTL